MSTGTFINNAVSQRRFLEKLSRGEKKELTFVLEDANGLQVRKTIVFDGDRYETDLSLQVKRGDAVGPQVKVAIGPSIGDQGISHPTF